MNPGEWCTGLTIAAMCGCVMLGVTLGWVLGWMSFGCLCAGFSCFVLGFCMGLGLSIWGL